MHGKSPPSHDQLYHLAMGSLLYLSIGTRPDITFMLSVLWPSSVPNQQNSVA